MAQLSQTNVEDLNGLVFENDTIKMTILPDLGAKVISLVLKANGHEYLWRYPGRPLRLPEYDSTFTDYDISAWDECFPTIYPVPYPLDPWKGIQVPDHGEVWALPWRWEMQGEALRMWTHSIRFGYHFERTFRLTDDGAIEIAYSATNPTAFPLHSLWSMHPFFNVTPTSRILLPTHTRIRVEASKYNRLGGFMAEHPWPRTVDTHGLPTDMGLLGSPEQAINDKLYTTPLTQGWAALFDPQGEHYLAFTFDPREVPFLGICLIRGGWPVGGIPAFTAILEPCKGWPDRLDLAMTQGASFEVPAGGECRWNVNLHLGTGWDKLSNIVGSEITMNG
jgi:hypothetical protein